MTTHAAWIVLCAGLSACATRAPRDAAELERRLREDAVTEVRTGRFELTSPFDAAGTERFAEVVGEELALVEALFGAPAGPPVRVHLVPLDPADADARDRDLCTLFPSHGGISAGTFGAEFVCVYVTNAGGGARAFGQADLRRGTIRHEMTHVVAERTGLSGATWFDEGVAREVETMDVRDGRLAGRPFPAALVRTRTSARPGTAAELLAWTSADELTPADRARRYDEAQALLRFLVERADGGFVDRVRAIDALGDEAIAASEPEWLDWLASQDALTAIRAGLASPDPHERTRAAALLPALAGDAAELRCRAADELALELVRDPAARESAETFLLFFRAKHVTAADLASIRADADPPVVLVGEALRARRGETFDAARAQEIWGSLPPTQRAGSSVAAHFLGLTTAR